MAIFLILVTPVAFLTPLQVARSFGDDVWRLTAIEIAFSGGMMAGGAIIATWGGFKNKIHTMTLSIFLFGAITFLLGFTPIFSLYLVFMTISGCLCRFLPCDSSIAGKGRSRFSREDIWCFNNDLQCCDAFRNACFWSSF